MATNDTGLQSLFQKYMDDTCTREEWDHLLQLVREEKNEAEFETAFKTYWNSINPAQTNAEYWNEHFSQMMSEAKEVSVPVVQMKRRRTWIRWVAAACILLIAGISTYVILSGVEGGHKEQPTAQTPTDIKAPANTRAVITLANGSKVYLDSAGNGILAQQNNVNVVRNADGSIEYNRKDAKTLSTQSDIVYNTIFNPRGSKVISLTLSDGTKVWLNSESSLRYPASFASSSVNREVEITGEAYFEVKHNSKQPFRVHLPNGSIVEDLGTAFNINSYSDEDNIKTTLIEGSVRLFANSAASASSAVKIKPGEQAVLNQANLKISRIEVQTNEVTAWKENKFWFDGADIHSIARQLSRWYNVEVEIKNNIPEHFSGIINRDVPVSQVFDMLQKTGAVHFEIENKKIVVTK